MLQFASHFRCRYLIHLCYNRNGRYAPFWLECLSRCAWATSILAACSLCSSKRLAVGAIVCSPILETQRRVVNGSAFCYNYIIRLFTVDCRKSILLSLWHDMVHACIVM